MSKQIPITQQQSITLPQIEQVRFNNSEAEATKAATDALATIGTNVTILARRNFDLRTEAEMRQTINKLEVDFAADPEGLNKELNKFRGDLLSRQSNFGSRDAIANKFAILASPTYAKVASNKLAVEKNNNELLSQQNLSVYEDGIYKNAPSLFSQNPAIAKAANDQILNSSGEIDKVLTSVGVDGKPMFTPEQIQARRDKIRIGTYSAASKDWIKNQPNKLKAYQDWTNDKVHINIADQNGQISKVFPRGQLNPLEQEKVDAELLKDVRDDLYIKSQFKKQNDDARGEFQSKQLVNDALNGYVTLDPTSNDSQKAVDSYWKQRQNSLIQQGKSTKEILDDSLPIIQKTGIMPAPIKSVISANIINGDTEQRAAFSKYVVDASEVNPKILNDLPTPAKAMAFSVAKNLRAGLSTEQAVGWAMNDLNEAKKEDNQLRENKWGTDKKSQAKRTENFISEVGTPLFSKNPVVPEAMVNEYSRLSRGYFVNEKVDAETADAMALKQVKSQWGQTDIGGKRFMKYAPETIYGNEDNWVHKQFESDFKIPKNEATLEVDYSTTNTNKPSYFVMKKNAFGGIEPVLDERNMPKKFIPDYAKVKQAKIQENLTEGKGGRTIRAFHETLLLGPND